MALFGAGDRLVVAGVGVAEHPHRGIGFEDPLDAARGRVGAVGDDHLPRVERVADAHAAAVISGATPAGSPDVRMRGAVITAYCWA